MTDTKLAFLCKAAASLPHVEENRSMALLKSYYLMRCKDVTKGYGLPEKQFSSKIRCAHCCLEWSGDVKTRIRPIKLNKKQRQQIRSLKVKNENKAHINNRKELLKSNEIEQICTWCKCSTITTVLKPEKNLLSTKQSLKVETAESKTNQMKNVNKAKIIKSKEKHAPTAPIQQKEVNIYSMTKEIFSINNKNNNTPNVKKEEPKTIKHNKKKKDKFAGLCRQAVLASAKLKEADKKKSKLNLFLKPSTSK